MVTLAEEMPFAAAVNSDYLRMICSSCFSTKGNKSRCIGCKVVSYCDKDCQKKDWIDHKHECSFLKNYFPKIPPDTCRLIARIAMKLKRPEAKEPTFNGGTYKDLVDHLEDVQKDAKRMMTFVTYLRGLRLYMGDKAPDPDLLLTIFGKVVINLRDIKDDLLKCGQGLYLGLTGHNHGCIPDFHIVFDGCKALFRSPDPSKKYSKDLTVSHTDFLFTNQDRQQKLPSRLYFTCTCARCSDPTLDFLYNSARSTCCPESYCLLDPAAKKLTCHKCGTVSGITVKKAIAANEEVRVFDHSDVTFDIPTLIKAYEKFSKILSPLNLNLLRVNEQIVNQSFELNYNSPICRKYAEYLLPANRRYLTVGHPELSMMLLYIANAMSHEFPATVRAETLFEETLAAFSVSHGPRHPNTLFIHELLSLHRTNLMMNTFVGFRC